MRQQEKNGPAGLSGYDSWNSEHVVPSFPAARSRKRKLLAELSTSRQEGHALSPEALLARWPVPPETDSDAARLLFADYHERCAQGEETDFSTYARRFPAHRDALQRLFDQHALKQTHRLANGSFRVQFALPSVGDEVFGFRLWHELGAGAFARVFLAEQSNLAGRPVVVKVSDRADEEPQTLAQLQHTNIVPIYSVHGDAESGLRVVCMPYFGGASLTSVLDSLGAETGRPTRGEDFNRALDRVQAPTLAMVKASRRNGLAAPPDAPPPAGQTPCQLLRSQTYFQAVAWIVARLAEGLQHAHDRGILHRDIKPSNILVGADGQPMLLDFNLAFQQRDKQVASSLGGTIPYMAPEHLLAFKGRTFELAQRVDNRSDIYSLGLVLFEMLAGQASCTAPDQELPGRPLIDGLIEQRSQAAPSVRRCRSDVPWSLESIVRKCLAPDPKERYQQAEHLAEDLRRFLDDRPLQYAPELSWTERASKWLRRHPRLTSSGSVLMVAALVLAATTTMLIGVRTHLAVTQKKLEEEEDQKRVKAFRAGTEQALLLINAVTPLQDHLPQGLKVCEETLGLYSILHRDDWQSQPAWQRLNPEDRQRLAEEAQELLLLLAWGRVRAGADQEMALHDALRLLDRANAIAGLPPSAALWHERRRYLKLLGDTTASQLAWTREQELQPTRARDHYMLATAHLHGGSPADQTQAIAELNRAIGLNPHNFWSWFRRGFCHLQRKDFQLAAADFGVCTGLWPQFAWGHFNLGYAHYQSGRKEEAILNYTAALECDRAFVDAYLNRGLANLDLRQYAAALEDFQKAAALRPEDAALHAGRGLALEGLRLPADADDAFRRAFARLPSAPALIQDHILVGYGFAVRQRHPQEARAAFDQVLARNPQHREALYGRALLAVEEGQSAEAVGYLDRCIAAAPGWMEPRRHRAIQLARCGRFAEALAAAQACLDHEPQVGATLYAAACVHARAAEAAADEMARQAASAKALDFLSKAFARNHGQAEAATDPDLAAIRGQVQQLLAQYGK